MDKNALLKGLREFSEQNRMVPEIYNNPARLVLSELWCLLRYGARPVDYVRFEFYKKNGRERNRYLSWGRYMRMKKLFGMYNEATYGKIAEYKTFSDYIHRPWMVAARNTNQQSIKDFIQGKGVMKINADDDCAIEELLNDCKNDAYVVEGVIEQIPEIAAINSSSINTIRAYTLLQCNGNTQILGIMLRAGRKGSHVDNWGSGGIGYDFDIETGVCVGFGKDKKNNSYIYHPGSNVQMVGFRLPDFENLKKIIIELTHKVPEARFVGWDIAITPNGYELVEMNCPGGHDFLQAFGKPFGDLLKRELK